MHFVTINCSPLTLPNHIIQNYGYVAEKSDVFAPATWLDRGVSLSKCLIVGYGNPDREDDGVAWHILQKLAQHYGLGQPDAQVETIADLDLNGLEWSVDRILEVLRVDVAKWRPEVPDIEKFFSQFGTRLPTRMSAQLRALAARLG